MATSVSLHSASKSHLLTNGAGNDPGFRPVTQAWRIWLRERHLRRDVDQTRSLLDRECGISGRKWHCDSRPYCSLTTTSTASNSLLLTDYGTPSPLMDVVPCRIPPRCSVRNGILASSSWSIVFVWHTRRAVKWTNAPLPFLHFVTLTQRQEKGKRGEEHHSILVIMAVKTEKLSLILQLSGCL